MQPLKFQAQMIFIYAAGEKKEAVFFFTAGFFPLLFGFGMQTMSQLDEQASEVSWTPDPSSRWLRLRRHHLGSSPTCLAEKDFML